MIFGLPFDLMVMFRTFPPEPATRYTLPHFLPLFMVEISTLSLLTFSPLTRISRYTLFCVAAMFLVFAIWAHLGLHYPSAPIPLALNVASKLLSFAVAVTMFLPSNRRTIAE